MNPTTAARPRIILPAKNRRILLPAEPRRRRMPLAEYHRAPSDHDSFDESDGGAFIESAGHARDIGLGNFYIAGAFTTKGAGTMRRLAVKDKVTGTITEVGGGIGSGIIKCMCTWNGFLVLGGSQAEGGGKNKIQTWDGSAFGALGNGITNGPAGYSVNAVAAIGKKLYVAGNFTEVNGVAMNNLACYDADLAAWVDLGGADGVIYDMVAVGSVLYIVGAFTTIGGVSIKNKATYTTGGGFAVMGGPVGPAGTAETYSVGFYNSLPIVTGNWTRIDGSTSAFNANHVALYSTSDGLFHKMDTPTDGFDTGSPTVGRRILQVGSRTFFTGSMTAAGNKSSVGRFAAWDGTNFQKYATGFGGAFGNCLYYWKSLLYIGGRIPAGTGGRLRTFDPNTDTFDTADDSWGNDIWCFGEY